MFQLPARTAWALPALLVLAGLCFAPGLGGAFLFDDFPNLDPLAVIAPESWFSPAFWQFVTSGEGGPLGRPLALFSFALQATAWPTDPFAFKLVNLLIHLGNGVLLYRICLALARPLGLRSEQVALFCFAVTGVWLLHPVHASVVLYAVQRETALASTFVLLGILLHLLIRLSPAARTEPRKLLLLSASLSITGLLGLFTKEMAAVLLCYLLTLEYTVLANVPASPLLRWWRRLFLWLPLTLLGVITLWYWQALQSEYLRYWDFTMAEKLYTEGRVLWRYLFMLVVPYTANLELFQLPPLSHSLLDPPLTLVAALCWLGLVVFAWLRRARYPLLAFAVFWYLGGHLVESTLLPLDLMFNHRNYLPFLGPLIGLGYGLCCWRWQGQALSPRLAWSLVLVVCTLTGLRTLQQSQLWGDTSRLASAWYLADPHNPTNVEFFALQLSALGPEQVPTTAALYGQLIAEHPGSDRYLLNRLLLSCKYATLPFPDAHALSAYLQTTPHYDNDVVGPLRQLVSLADSNLCPGLEPALLMNIASRLQAVVKPESAGPIEYEQGRLAMIMARTGGDDGISAALAKFRHAFELSQDPGIAFKLAGYYLQQHNNKAALELIDQAESLLQRHNDIATGTRAAKLAALARLRSLAQAQQAPVSR